MKIVLLFIFVFSFLYGDFTKSGDVVINNHSNLEWQDNAVGNKITWREAIEYCKNLTLDGNGDWRLPNINELKSIIDKSRYEPAIVSAFMNTASGTTAGYWSSTTYEPSKTKAWIVLFGNGKESIEPKTYHAPYTRCVRGGQ